MNTEKKSYSLLFAIGFHIDSETCVTMSVNEKFFEIKADRLLDEYLIIS